jgi:hypothetical protein
MIFLQGCYGIVRDQFGTAEREKKKKKCGV